MTRKETELQILEKLKEIRSLALAYSPDDNYLTLFFLNDHINFSNGNTPVKKLDCWEKIGSGEGPYHQGLEADDA